MASFLSLFSVPGSAPQQSAPAPVQGVDGSRSRIEQAFAAASQATGLPFDYFMTTAMRESSLDVNAAAATSSARGPFQFIEQTWLSMLHSHGEAVGLADAASAIERRPDGRYSIPDTQAREAVLGLRHDPQLSAVMSGLYLRENAASLEAALGRPVSVGEGYVAHVFGAAGAARLIELAETQPGRTAAAVFPVQAEANRGLFYTRGGEPVTVKALYDRLVGGFPQDTVPAATPTEVTVRAPGAGTAGQPLDLEPAGFDALPQAAPAGPDVLAARGLFVPAGGAAVPFFAALYSPEGLDPVELAEESVGTSDVTPGPARRTGMPEAETPATEAPLDLLSLARASYAGPAARGADLVPPA